MNALVPFLAALTAAPEKIPDLKPPRGEIPPTLWEGHSLALCFAGVMAVVVLVSIIQHLRRPKPVIPPTLADIARDNLKALQGCPEAARVNTEAARVLRGFLIAKFGLAGPGLTADEIAGHLPTDGNLAAGLYQFLHQCDVANFAPAAPAPASDAVIDQAINLLDAVERPAPAPAPQPSGTTTS